MNGTDLEHLRLAIAKPLDALGIRVQVKQHQTHLNLILNHRPEIRVDYGAASHLILRTLQNLDLADLSHVRILGRIIGEKKAQWQQMYSLPPRSLPGTQQAVVEKNLPEEKTPEGQPESQSDSQPECQFVGRPGFYWNFLGNGYSIPALGTMILFIKDGMLIARRKGFLESSEIWMPLATINSLEFYQTPMYLFSYLGFMCIIGTVFVRSLILLAPILIVVAFLFRSKHIIVKNYTNTIIFFGADVQDYNEIIRSLKLMEHPNVERI